MLDPYKNPDFSGFFCWGFQAQVGKSPDVWGCPSRTESRTLGVLSLLGFQFDRLRKNGPWKISDQGRMGTGDNGT